MIFRRTLRGTLLSQEDTDKNNRKLTIEDEKGKIHQLTFNKNNIGSCSINEEVYLGYNDTPFIKNKKGLWITNNIYLANQKTSSTYFKYTKPFFYRLVIPFLTISSLQFFMTLYNTASYIAIFGITFIAFFFLQYFLGQYIKKDTERFIIEKPTKGFFENYFKNKFSFMQKTINRNISDEDKDKLRKEINDLDISSTLKFEYLSLIDNNSLNVADIKKIEYYRQKSHIDSMSNINY